METGKGSASASLPSIRPVREKGVFVQLAAGDSVRNLGPNGAAIGEEGGAAMGDELGLVLHVLAAAGACEGSQARTKRRDARHARRTGDAGANARRYSA